MRSNDQAMLSSDQAEAVVVEFAACEHLDFGPDSNYLHCHKQLLAASDRKTYVFWLRDTHGDPDLPGMVQFCTLRGRLNHPTSCLSPNRAECSLYAHALHTVTVENP